MTSPHTRSRSSVPRPDWSRRECLQVLGASLVGAVAWPTVSAVAASDDLKQKAKQNLRLGVDANPYSQLPVAEAVRRIREEGFSNVLTSYTFADVRFDPWNPDWKAADTITGCFREHDVRIATVFGYFNVVDPDPARRRKGEERMEFFIANWKRLGCPLLSTETGTLNRESEWVDAPENESEESYVACRKAFERLVRLAEKSGAVIAFEAYWQNIIRTIERAERILNDIPSPAFQLVMDPCNYLRKEDLPQMQPLLEDMFRRLGSRIAVAHAKDVKAAEKGTDLPASGLGVLDYPLYLRLLAQLDRPLDLIVEHVTLPDVPRARDYVLAQLEKV